MKYNKSALIALVVSLSAIVSVINPIKVYAFGDGITACYHQGVFFTNVPGEITAEECTALYNADPGKAHIHFTKNDPHECPITAIFSSTSNSGF